MNKGMMEKQNYGGVNFVDNLNTVFLPEDLNSASNF